MGFLPQILRAKWVFHRDFFSFFLSFPLSPIVSLLLSLRSLSLALSLFFTVSLSPHIVPLFPFPTFSLSPFSLSLSDLLLLTAASHQAVTRASQEGWLAPKTATPNLPEHGSLRCREAPRVSHSGLGTLAIFR